MNADTIAAIQAGRLDFQALLSRPFAFADSPSINSPEPAPEVQPAPVAAAPAPVPVAPVLPAGAKVRPALFPGRCARCGQRFPAGTSIVWQQADKTTKHADLTQCGVPAPVPAAAPADDRQPVVMDQYVADLQRKPAPTVAAAAPQPARKARKPAPVVSTLPATFDAF